MPCRKGGLTGLALALLLSACATQLYVADDLPRRQELRQVPFHPQQRYQCGPAALASVLNWSGIDIAPGQLSGQLFVPEQQGSLQVEMLAATRRHDRIPYILPPRLEALIEELAAGHPVLVLQNLSLDWAPRWHYAVVVGYDLNNKQFLLRSGLEQRQTLSIHSFDHSWAGSGRWAMLALPADALPANAEPATYLQAVVELERQGHLATAQSAYRTALKRWPDNLVAQMGLGNTAYALGDRHNAELAFRTAIHQHPDSAAAHNNLAQTLLDRNALAEAERHARLALQLAAGKDSTLFRQTLATILQRKTEQAMPPNSE